MNIPDWMVFTLHGIAVFVIAIASYLYLVKEVANAAFSQKNVSSSKHDPQQSN